MDIHQIELPISLSSTDLSQSFINNFAKVVDLSNDKKNFVFVIPKTIRLHFDEENQYYYLLNGIIENNSDYIKKLMIYKYSSSGRLIKTFIQKIYCHKEFFFESPPEFFV